jgi:hypothetical protein
MALDLRDRRDRIALSKRFCSSRAELYKGSGPLAPTQSEPPFAITQAGVLVIFILIGLIAVAKFRPITAVRM